MAITGAIFNSLIFGNVNSANYGIYITGAGAFNAPERAVELVSIPGRNGAIAIDQGRYENIEVTYPAGVFGDDATDFRTRFAEFRNAMKAQIGYQRLTDTYNPNEYRMALFISAIEIDPVAQNKAGEFSIVFNCKPQRWLTSGETEVTITSGNTLTNPTLYDASPLIKALGTGDIALGDQTISIQQKPLGRVSVAPAQAFQSGVTPRTITLNVDTLNSGDPIYLDLLYNVELACKSGITLGGISPGDMTGGVDYVDFSISDNYRKGFVTYMYKPTIYYETAASGSGTADFEFTWYDGNYNDRYINITFAYTYDGDSTVTLSYSTVPADPAFYYYNICNVVLGYAINETFADSTRLTFIDPIYIDCDLGEAYLYISGEITSANNLVSLGSDLPVLAPGGNTITYDNTITSLVITPRWWQL